MKKQEKNNNKNTGKIPENSNGELHDELSEMESFLRKKRLQNEVLKKLTENKDSNNH